MKINSFPRNSPTAALEDWRSIPEKTIVNKRVAAFRSFVISNNMSSEFTDFTTEIEHELASLWQQVLNTDFLPRPSDDFFSLGGDSVAMIMAEVRIKEEFSIDFPEGAMLGVSSLRELSLLIARYREPSGMDPQ
jgi:acyl carrier protein